MRISRGFVKNPERVLITGASGFVGSHLARFLFRKGCEIWGVFHRHRREFDFPIRWVRADLTQREAALQLVSQSRPHAVFHMAGQAVPHLAFEKQEFTMRINVAAAIYLFEGIARYAPRARVVAASSSHVYGSAFKALRRVSERVRPEPATPYGAGKFLMELAALNFVTRHGLDIRIVRAFNQVGAGLNPAFVFSEFCRQVAMMEKGLQHPVLKAGDISVIRDFIHIRDAVRAYELICRRGRRGEVYNLGLGRGMRLGEAVDFLRVESGIPFRLKSEKSRYGGSNFPCIVSDSRKLGRLGWRPRESVRTALKEILEEYRC